MDPPSNPPGRRRLLLLALAASAGVRAGVAAAAGDDLAGDAMPYEAFERLPVQVLEVGAARIRLAFGPGRFDIERQRIVDYVRQSARSVAVYFGRFPVATARVLVLCGDAPGRPVRSGAAFGERGAAIRLTLARAVSAAELDDDWIMVHEMCHLALPSLPRRHHWFEEGMASYVEPLARAQAGVLAVERVWADMVQGLPKGLPQDGDRGLDHTPTWGRTYWGGALFCLLADIDARQASGGARGLQHALRAMLEHADIESESPIEPLFAIGDRAIGAPVLAELYARMKDSASPVDLDALWQRLGVRVDTAGVVFDDAAPQAAIRKALTRAPTS